MERLQRLQLFAHAHELNRAAGHCLDRQCRTTAGVTIHLSQNQTSQLQIFVEAFRHVHGILTGHSIYNQQNFVRLYLTLDVLQLLHQFLIDVQAACGINDHHIIGVGKGIIQG